MGRCKAWGLHALLPVGQGQGPSSPAQCLLGVQAELIVDVPGPQFHNAVGEGGLGAVGQSSVEQSRAISVSAGAT